MRMKIQCAPRFLVRVLSAAWLAGFLNASVEAANITLSVQEGAGQDWNTLGKWSDGSPAGVSALANPSNTYEILVGGLLRTPNGTVVSAFPGQTLTVFGNSLLQNPNDPNTGELRFRQSPPTGTVTFPKLVLNGGQLNLDSDGVLVLAGQTDVASKSVIFNDSGKDRGCLLTAWLTGGGDLEFNGSTNSGFDASKTNGLIIGGLSNTFTGRWTVTRGLLVGSGANSLGTNQITVNAEAGLETAYDVNNPDGRLVLNGQMFLHQNDVFGTVIIKGDPLAPGTHSFDALAAQYTNFPRSWFSHFGGGGESNGSGSITVINTNIATVGFALKPLNARVAVGDRALFRATLTGPASVVRWYSNNVIIPGENQLTLVTRPVTPEDNNTVIKLNVANNINATNAISRLWVGTNVYSPGFLKDEIWFGSQYTRELIETNADLPGLTRYLSSFEADTNFGSDYVQRVSGYITPPYDAMFDFYVSAADDCDLYLSTDSDPSNKRLIARETAWSESREWNSSAGGSVVSQKCSAQFSPDGTNRPFGGGIFLSGEQQYYIEAVHHHASGPANLSVTYVFSGFATANGSPTYLASDLIGTSAVNGGMLTIENDPADVSANVMDQATFAVGIFTTENTVRYQWQRNGIDIFGATQDTYTTPFLSLTNNNSLYQVVVSVPGLPPQTSGSARLTINRGTPQPLTISQPVVVNGNLVFSFPTVLGVGYIIQANEALNTTNWINLKTIEATGGEVSFTNLLNSATRYYRVYEY